MIGTGYCERIIGLGHDRWTNGRIMTGFGGRMVGLEQVRMD